jgi:carbon-monoxide dehydrogenase small subunit
MKKHDITLTVDGEEHELEVDPNKLLIHVLRERLDITGPNVGCESSMCGACTVHLDGRAVKSCTLLAVQADDAEISTIEGLSDGNQLHPVQESFKEERGLQCGYCTPGMIMASTALLDENPDPSQEEIEEALEGNLCRCTGYQRIVNAVNSAASKMHNKGE